MANLQLNQNVEISFERILQGVASLETDDILQLMQDMGRILAHRNTPTMPNEEAVLLHAIAHTMPSKRCKNMKYLPKS